MMNTKILKLKLNYRKKSLNFSELFMVFLYTETALIVRFRRSRLLKSKNQANRIMILKNWRKKLMKMEQEHFTWFCKIWPNTKDSKSRTDWSESRYSLVKWNKVYQWDEFQKAWFPKVTEDFLANYQATYGSMRWVIYSFKSYDSQIVSHNVWVMISAINSIRISSRVSEMEPHLWCGLFSKIWIREPITSPTGIKYEWNDEKKNYFNEKDEIMPEEGFLHEGQGSIHLS